MNITARIWPQSVLIEDLGRLKSIKHTPISAAEHTATLNNSSGHLELKFWQHASAHIGLFHLKGQLADALSLRLKLIDPLTLHLYSLGGHTSLHLEGSPRKSLDKFKSHVIKLQEGEILLEFPPTFNFQLAILVIPKNCLAQLSEQQHSKGKLLQDERKEISTIPPEGMSLAYDLAFSEGIQALDQNNFSGLARKAFLQGQLSLLLAQQMHQVENYSEETEAEAVLNKRDLEVITKAINIIKKELGQNVKVKDLTERLGTNENKLQEGFRLVTGLTVKQYILEQRLNRAKDLLISSDYSVSEIVYRIGLTNRGYFSKIFKERYNFSPRTYRKGQRN